MQFYVYRKDVEKCVNCNFCLFNVSCASPARCVGCEACFIACPYGAVKRVEDKSRRRMVKLTVNGEKVEAFEFTTVKRALTNLGFTLGAFPGEGDVYAPCSVGGCYACSAVIDGVLKPVCTTPVREGMNVQLKVPEDLTPLRVVSGFQPHSVGGVGTPWQVKKSWRRYVEVACFTHGCNLRCPQCQNFSITYNNVEPPLTPREAAEIVTGYRRRYGVDRIAVSGGEPTLNRPWLTQYFRELRNLNKDRKARFHLDTNATILTPGYIDELVEAGVTDVGPDLKGLYAETFMKITGVTDESLARRYLENSWSAVKYVVDEYWPERLFIGVGIPYNKFFMSLEELREIGDRLAKLDSSIQVCVLNYFPTFRRLDMNEPSYSEMAEARDTLLASGLKTVLAQTSQGHIGP
jgi:pyruvate formate lyase activating enzyme